jgi:uncharacterized membrane protein HdeD (DUF308 family)
MDTTLDQFRQKVETQVTKARWALGINGALALVTGILIIVWPNISLYSLVIVFGAFSLARGIIGLGTAISSPVRGGRGWLVLSSLAGIAVGVVVFFWTDMSALALLYVIGSYAIILGALTMGAAFRLPLDGNGRLLLSVTGFISIIFGIVMFAKPGDGALVLLGLIAAYALIVGVSELVVAIGWDRLFDRAFKRAVTSSGPAPKPQASH